MILDVLLVSLLTFVSLNCENLFDCQHDSLKNDQEFLPEAPRHWTPYRYWQKLDNIGRAILSCGEDSIDCYIPDFVALCEVENDSVLRDLTKRSLLRNARYDYVMTDSRDSRGIDVALLYHEFSFSPIVSYSLCVEPVIDDEFTRDILYVSGRVITDDTLHIFVVHAPSRVGGPSANLLRTAVVNRLCQAIDSVNVYCPNARIIVAGDFNDYCDETSLGNISNHGMINVTCGALGRNGAKGSYRYKGRWESIDHIFLSTSLIGNFEWAYINDALFLIEDDEVYGGVKPRRTYKGYRYCHGGVSDHLPLVVRLRF